MVRRRMNRNAETREAETRRTDASGEGEAAEGPRRGWWRRWVVEPVKAQLVQGTTPEKLGWTIGTGVALGICPVVGTRGWMCLLAGWAFKLNQPVLHTFKGLSYPAHLALIIPLIQMGQALYGREPLRISLEVLKREVTEGGAGFWREFGGVILRATSVWLLLAPLVLVAVRVVATPVLRKAGVKEAGREENV